MCFGGMWIAESRIVVACLPLVSALLGKSHQVQPACSLALRLAPDIWVKHCYAKGEKGSEYQAREEDTEVLKSTQTGKLETSFPEGFLLKTKISGILYNENYKC